MNASDSMGVAFQFRVACNRMRAILLPGILTLAVAISPVLADESGTRFSSVGEARMLWQTGKSMVEHGEREIDRGRNLIREGREELLSGIETVERGIDLLKDGRDDIQVIEPDDVAEAVASRPLERGAKLVREGNKIVSSANRKISDGSLQIREGRSLIESGLTMMQSVERRPVE